jgi:hypothetical protein
MGSQLIRYDAMVAAIAKCHRKDEIQQIRNKAAQIRAAAKIANDKAAVSMATAIRFRAERRLGQLLKEQPKNQGTLKRGSAVPERNHGTPTLAQMGIDKKLSMTAQKLADVPDKEFDDAVDTAIAAAVELSPADVLKSRKRKAKTEKDLQDAREAEVVIPAAKEKDEREHVNELFGALEILSGFPIPAEEVQGKVLRYQQHRVTNHLEAANDFLSELRTYWRMS